MFNSQLTSHLSAYILLRSCTTAIMGFKQTNKPKPNKDKLSCSLLGLHTRFKKESCFFTCFYDFPTFYLVLFTGTDFQIIARQWHKTAFFTHCQWQPKTKASPHAPLQSDVSCCLRPSAFQKVQPQFGETSSFWAKASVSLCRTKRKNIG